MDSWTVKKFDKYLFDFTTFLTLSYGITEYGYLYVIGQLSSFV